MQEAFVQSVVPCGKSNKPEELLCMTEMHQLKAICQSGTQTQGYRGRVEVLKSTSGLCY